MKLRTLLLTLFVFLSACGGGGSSNSGADGDSEEDPATKEKEELIVVLGDSIGVGVSASTNFPDLVSGLSGIPAINTSRAGQSAENGASDISGLIERYNPKFIVMMLGTNNALGADAGVDGAINSNLFVARICQETGTICVLATLPPITLSKAADSRAESISNGIRGISTARIADVRAALNGRHIAADGIHPNTDGQFIISQVIADQIF